MDRVRFGRALGVGAREAARALAKAADAAAAPNPRATSASSPSGRASGGAANPGAIPAARPAASAVSRQVEQVKATSAGVKRGGRKFGEAMWAPLTRAGAVLWLEVTGVLFAMVALAFGVWVWQQRADLRGTGNAMHRAWLGVAMLVVFGYFTVSSYVRAAKRGRR